MTIAKTESGTLKRDAIGVWQIVFFVVAAAAPLAVVVGVTPYAFAFGNGTGVPLTFVLVGLMYLLFSVGYAAMSAHVGRAVSFYPYVVTGLGRAAGVGTAFISITSYIAVELMALTLFGIFGNSTFQHFFGVDLPWWVYCLALNVIVLLCGIRNIEFSGRILGCLMIAEVTILTVLGLTILAEGGGVEGITLTPFGISSLTSGSLGVALVFVVSAFIGFEATAIFGEEARNPRKTVPAATYLAVTIIALFYAFSTWVISLDYGPSSIVQAANANFTGLYQVSIENHLGSLMGVALQLLMLTSLFACVLSFHNTINRYFFVIGREGLIYSKLGRTHPQHQSPHSAAIVQFVLISAFVLLFTLIVTDPTPVVGWCSAFTSLGILIIQIIVSLAVIGFFRTNTHGVNLWRRMIAPALSAVALAVCLWLMWSNISLVSGSEHPLVKAFPIIILSIGVLGVLFTNWLKKARPETYARLGQVLQ